MSNGHSRRVGRPPLPPKDRRSEKLLVTLTRGERRRLERVVGAEPLSTYMRRVVLQHVARRERRGKMKASGYNLNW
jgi:hypothetical protein